LSCFEYSMFITVMTKLYFPNAEAKVITYEKSLGDYLRSIFNGELQLTNRHACCIFKDTDGQTYLYIVGQKVRLLEDQLQGLKHAYKKKPLRFSHIPKLLQKARNVQWSNTQS
jgi:hypothetical protein